MAAALHWPNNLGIEFRPLCLPTNPPTRLLAVFIHGMANVELVRLRVIEPLERVALQQPERGRLTAERLPAILPAPQLRTTEQMDVAIAAVLDGGTALFLDGAGVATLLRTDGPVERAMGGAVPANPYKECFSEELLNNVALVRKRLRDPNLVAEPHSLPGGRGVAALVRMAGRADPMLLGRVRGWVLHHMGEEAAHRGLAGRVAGRVGLLPEIATTMWPDKAAALLDAGYVLVMVDRIPFAYLTPVTAVALMYGGDDNTLRRPAVALVRVFRVILTGLLILLPALVVALLNYHQEMVPTPFLLGLAAIRESAGLPVVAEVLGLELLQEIMREATFRLPAPMTPGAFLICSILLNYTLVQGGVVGPLPALTSSLGAVISLSLSDYDLIYLARIWRYPVLFGAAIFGLYGVATVAFLLAVYLNQAESFGVPFTGESGLNFTAPGRMSSWRKGRERRAAAGPVR